MRSKDEAIAVFDAAISLTQLSMHQHPPSITELLHDNVTDDTQLKFKEGVVSVQELLRPYILTIPTGLLPGGTDDDHEDEQLLEALRKTHFQCCGKKICLWKLTRQLVSTLMWFGSLRPHPQGDRGVELHRMFRIVERVNNADDRSISSR